MLRNRPVVAAGCAVVLALACPAALLACGPFFPNQLLVAGDRALLTAPEASFYNEMGRLGLGAKPRFRAVVPEKGNPWRQTIEADVAELGAALKVAKMPEPQRAKTLASYRQLGESLRDEAHAWETPSGQKAPHRPDPGKLAPPAGLPGEFEDYIRGAILWRQNPPQGEAARRAWEKVLARPAVERRNRSTWAAFMIGRSLLDAGGDGPEKAIPWFERVRALAAEGFPDSLGLAAASYGWQALAEIKREHPRPVPAIHLYLEQLAAGDSSALASLQVASAAIFEAGRETLAAAAADAKARAVVTAFVISRGGPHYCTSTEDERKRAGTWLKAVELSAPEAFAGADRMALAAYQLGEMDAAGRWLKRAPDDSALANWLRAKLLMRAGRLDQAAARLARAVHGFPRDEQWCDPVGGLATWGDQAETVSPANLVRGELGTLQLARRHYVDALDQLVRGGFRLDAAYVAERVLKRDELLACVDASWPEPERKTEPAAGSAGAEVPGDAEWLRWVLARRLAREGRHDLARKYYPEDQQARFDEFTKALSEGRDRRKPAATRADALWKAARMARYRGLELFGTEDEPDWAWAGGSFQLDPASQVRSLPTGAADRSAKAAAVSSERSPDAFKEALDAKVNLSSPDERQRLRLHGVKPEKRFHYRYFAADLAWEAAALMADGSGPTAQVLCEAGTWLKDRDPKEADRFYKALVRRCRTTALGSEAETIRWFPKIEPTKP